MSSILDNVLANTEKNLGGANVVSEQHDISKIDWRAARGDVLEMAKMGRVSAAVAAQRRADLDTSTGKVAVMVAGAPAWHKLGVNVATAVTAAEAIKLASLGWDVEKVAAQYPFVTAEGVQEWRTAKGVFLVVRKDTGAALGAVGGRYKPIQNAEGFDFLDAVMADHGARYETAGAVHGGAKVWMQVRLPQQSFEVAPGDEVVAYATFFNPHDGSGAGYVYPTTNRVVCNNTLRVANAGKSRGISLRHSGDIKGRIKDAREALGLAVKGFEEFKDAADVLVTTPVPVAEKYFNAVLDSVLDLTEAKMRLGAPRLAQEDMLAGIISTTEARAKAELAYTKAIADRGAILDDIITRYESERCGVGGIRGTAWAALNAVTEHADHYQAGRKVGSDEERASRLFESVLAGDRDTMKQAALGEALRLAS